MGGLLKSGIAAGAAPVLITAPLTLALACGLWNGTRRKPGAGPGIRTGAMPRPSA